MLVDADHRTRLRMHVHSTVEAPRRAKQATVWPMYHMRKSVYFPGIQNLLQSTKLMLKACNAGLSLVVLRSVKLTLIEYRTSEKFVGGVWIQIFVDS